MRNIGMDVEGSGWYIIWGNTVTLLQLIKPWKASIRTAVCGTSRMRSQTATILVAMLYTQWLLASALGHLYISCPQVCPKKLLLILD
jgi:hypothetical protein